jgi:hypothetical protein
LADGTHIQHERQTVKSYRDSQGRTREEHYMSGMDFGCGQSDILIDAAIYDPVAGTISFLEPRYHRAHVMSLNVNLHHVLPPPPADNATPPPPMPRRTLPKVTHEDLGTQTMEGLLVQGTRTTETIPMGAQGNDRPMQIVTEEWTSKELHITVFTKHSDPRSGEETTRLTNIDRSEPDLSLFQIPPDYTIEQPQ